LFGGRPQHLILHGQLGDLAFGLPQRPIITGPLRPLALQALTAGSQEIIPPGGQLVRLDLQPRDSSSSDSPRSNRSTTSVFSPSPADQRGCAR
jgi:hypothetical protein